MYAENGLFIFVLFGTNDAAASLGWDCWVNLDNFDQRRTNVLYTVFVEELCVIIQLGASDLDNTRIGFESHSLKSIQNKLDAVVNVRSACYELGRVGLERPVSALGAYTVVIFGTGEEKLDGNNTRIACAAEKTGGCLVQCFFESSFERVLVCFTWTEHSHCSVGSFRCCEASVLGSWLAVNLARERTKVVGELVLGC